MKIEFNRNFFNRYFWCSVFIFVEIILLFYIFTPHFSKPDEESFKNFLPSIENKTFDLRQTMTTKYRHVNKDIVILAIDDSTYEYVLENYGDWPMPRYLYADIVNYIEAQKPRLIAFDTQFIKPIKDEYNSDEKLTEVFKKYNNLYLAYSFDYIDEGVRKPVQMDKKLAVNLDNQANIEVEKFTNTKPILKSLLEATSNFGCINVLRDSDGVIRGFLAFSKYQDNIYPALPLVVSQDLMNSKSKNYTVDKNLRLKFNDKSYPIKPNGEMYLNWYGESGSFEHIPMWKIIKASQQYKQGISVSDDLKYDFENKIIYQGITDLTLNDIKTVPVAERFPGVELHTTFINNMLDNNFIQKTGFKCDFLTTFILSLVLGLSMLKIDSSKINYKYLVPINSAILLFMIIFYYFFTIFVMVHYNLWIALVMPILGLLVTFISIYLIKYFFKSKDYEYTYRLATTDGLTELYNHRFFQEQMIANIEISKRYGSEFSLIMTDIDFFKKFNDKYGHQAGDAVLRQVARILKKNVRNIDLVCRYGGEEMSLILINTNKEDAILVANKLRDVVSSEIFKLSSTQTSHVTISLGVATYPNDGSTPSELIEVADKGLYMAKENGRNQVGVVNN